jgi:spore maturation protein CgeB
MRILYFGPTWEGSTTVQRFQAMGRQPGVEAVQVSSGGLPGTRSVPERIMWKLRWPIDFQHENESLLRETSRLKPDVVFVEGSKVVTRRTLAKLRRICNPILAFYTPDDIIAPHNLSFIFRHTFADWDVFFTTKTFNLLELRERGVRNPVLVGKAYDPDLHRPYNREDVGDDYERFDCVFIGMHEAERERSITALAAAGLTVAVLGNSSWGWDGHMPHPNITLRPPEYHHDYARKMHIGKLALCFLRKINRDRLTQRSVEIPAMARPMVAERTDEHDAYFAEGVEYIGFESDEQLVRKAKTLLAAPQRIAAIAAAGKRRCEQSGYDTDSRARDMLIHLRRVRQISPRALKHDEHINATGPDKAVREL